jgi:hypothetical protein
MISKYFPLTSVLVMTLLLLSSCLNSSTDNVEYSPDAQIYALTLSSKTDTASLLTATQFTIDQINGKIFNKEPLPYLFHIDSVLLSLRGASSYSPFSQVLLTLDQESPSLWRESDSVAVNQLRKITTTAPDGIHTKEYSFELNIYQEDPFIINWQQLHTNFLPIAPLSQNSIAFNGNLITYYKSTERIEAVMTEPGNEPVWHSLNIAGLPSTTDLSTATVNDGTIFMLDPAGYTLYHSTDGIAWNSVPGSHKIGALYGTLPAPGEDKLLLAVEQDNMLFFAETTDFTEVTVMNKVPDHIPVNGFTTTKVDDPTSYSVKYLLLAGGNTTDNSLSNQIWILQKKEGTITSILSRMTSSLILQSSTLFYYDNKPYLMTPSTERNILFFSGNFGLDWEEAEENQAFPAGFTKRSNASVITDSENYIWIFGGISAEQAQLTDVWRGRLNKFNGM